MIEKNKIKFNLTCRIIVQVCSLQMSWSSSKWPWHLQVTLKCVGLGYGTGKLCKGKKIRQMAYRQLFLHIVAFWQVFIWCKIGLVSFWFWHVTSLQPNQLQIFDIPIHFDLTGFHWTQNDHNASMWTAIIHHRVVS